MSAARAMVFARRHVPVALAWSLEVRLLGLRPQIHPQTSHGRRPYAPRLWLMAWPSRGVPRTADPGGNPCR
eukprot:scaffold12465_cov119-Isochrysis_galbana.AAC.9